MIKEIKNCFYIIFHPFKGFWDVKCGDRGTVRASLFLLVLCALTNVLKCQFTGYLFNEFYPEKVKVVVVIARVVILFFLWCLANWCLTTLMEGEGTFKKIMISIGYCLLPLIFANVLILLFSNILSLEETSILTYLNVFSYIWSGFLIFSASCVVHQYTATKTVVTILLTIIVIVFFVFIGLLCISLIQQVVSFFSSVYNEFIYRI